MTDKFAKYLCYKISVASTNDSSTLELDSHTDLPVVGTNAHVLRSTGDKIKVSGFTDELGSKTVDIVDTALTYDFPSEGKSYLLIIRNALHIKSMRSNLIPPFMMRLAGLEVNECPKFMAKSPTIEHHSLYFPDDRLRIPLGLSCTISYIPVRTPTNDELEEPIDMLDLRPNIPTWDPHNPIYSEQEESMLKDDGTVKDPPRRKFIISSILTEDMDPTSFNSKFLIKYNESGIAHHNVNALKTANGTISKLKPQDLVKIWNIGLEIARRTLGATTRLNVRNASDITLNRRYAMNDRMIRYKHLPINLFSDTMFASKKMGKCIPMTINLLLNVREGH